MEAAMRSSSFCAYGRSAASVVLSAMRAFADEFAAHAVERRCPADWCSMEAM
jgi:NADH:ubiquinone oxidoreductase subunit F (NADH-binding)